MTNSLTVAAEQRHLFSRHRFKWLRHLCCLSVVFMMVFAPLHNASAQTLDKKKLMAVMNVINNYLLSGLEPPIETPAGPGVVLALGQLSPDTYTVSENLYAEFALQEEAVELCFIIESTDVVQPGDLSVEINGKPVAAQLGENCFSVSRSAQRLINYINLIVNAPGIALSMTTLELQPSLQTQLTLRQLTRGGWDERAVRKVLKIFAFGGHATDEQILAWANMSAEDAIVEMLNFSEHNLKLSPVHANDPYKDTETQAGTLTEWLNFLSSPTSNTPIPTSSREQYGINSYNFDDGYGRMITVRGLNPFRQRIGFWETNYHLATNLDANVSRPQMAAYYDLIMEAHEDGLPYHEVMGIAAKSAAVAMQYGHRRNECEFDDDLNEYECDVNDDFAREIHQLFYGIFGVDDPDHEDVTIPQTARMLTDMPVFYNDGYDLFVTFGTSRHHVDDLLILGQTISGADASAKIDNLMPISMQHPESLQNLPVMIISVLADDNLSEFARDQLRAAWAAMGSDKYLLDFIRAYAVSEMFHGPQQIKYLTSHERALYTANKNNLDNLEAYFGGASYSGRAGRSVGGSISDDAAGDFFRPLHNVFGGQTSFEAADSALVFENNYNRLTDEEHLMRQIVQCDGCDLTNPWEKRWPDVLPRAGDGEFYVADVAAWLWNHAVGSLDNYSELERAHLYSLLGAAHHRPGNGNDQRYYFDFNLLMCVVEDYQRKEPTPDLTIDSIMGNDVYNDYCRENDDEVDGFTAQEQAALNRVYTGQMIADDPLIQDLLLQLGNRTLPLESTGETYSSRLRERARERVNNTLGFIFATPFVFAEGQ